MECTTNSLEKPEFDMRDPVSTEIKQPWNSVEGAALLNSTVSAKTLSLPSMQAEDVLSSLSASLSQLLVSKTALNFIDSKHTPVIICSAVDEPTTFVQNPFTIKQPGYSEHMEKLLTGRRLAYEPSFTDAISKRKLDNNSSYSTDNECTKAKKVRMTSPELTSFNEHTCIPVPILQIAQKRKYSDSIDSLEPTSELELKRHHREIKTHRVVVSRRHSFPDEYSTEENCSELKEMSGAKTNMSTHIVNSTSDVVISSSPHYSASITPPSELTLRPEEKDTNKEQSVKGEEEEKIIQKDGDEHVSGDKNDIVAPQENSQCVNAISCHECVLTERSPTSSSTPTQLKWQWVGYFD